jgi:beta-phosphoglucomutase-like phosphatase (HAD superfamily)
MNDPLAPAGGAGARAIPGLNDLAATSDGRFRAGEGGVRAVQGTSDRKVELVHFETHTLAHVLSSMGYPAYYPVPEARLERPVRAVLMDLDGTTVRSEHFWIWIIQKTIASLLGHPKFELEEADTPHVSGHSVSEHLQYGIRKYCPEKTVEEARRFYFEHTNFEMKEIMEGRGREGAFTPSPGVKEFLLELKGMGVKLGLVTSGLYEKGWPEILSAFKAMKLGDPKEFYDAIVTAGFAIRKGEPGTLGELQAKPHPWLYAETARVGLGIDFKDRHHVVGIEDSGAGVCSVRLAGFTAIGMADGNINESGTRGFCSFYADTFAQVIEYLK